MKEPVLVLTLLFLCNAGECKPALGVKYKLAVDMTDSNNTEPSEQAKIPHDHKSYFKESRDTKTEEKIITVSSNRQEPSTEQPETIITTNSTLKMPMEITNLVKTAVDYNLQLELDLTTDNVSLKEEVNEWIKIGEDLTIEEEVSYYNQSGDKAQNTSDVSERVPPNHTTFSAENKCNSTLGEYDQKYGYQEVYFDNDSSSPKYFLALLRAYFADVECNLVLINSSGPQLYSWANKSLETNFSCKAIENMRNRTQRNEFRIYFLPDFNITKVNFVLPKKCFPRQGDKIVVAMASTFVIAGAIVLIAVGVVVIRRRKRAKIEQSQHKHTLRNRLPILLPGEPITPNKEGRDNPAFVLTLPSYTSLKDLL